MEVREAQELAEELMMGDKVTEAEKLLRALVAISPPTPVDYPAKGAAAFRTWERELIEAQNSARMYLARVDEASRQRASWKSKQGGK